MSYPYVAVKNAIVDIYIRILIRFEGGEVALQSLGPRAKTPSFTSLVGLSDNNDLKLFSDLFLNKFAPLLNLCLQQVEHNLNRWFLTGQIV